MAPKIICSSNFSIIVSIIIIIRLNWRPGETLFFSKGHNSSLLTLKRHFMGVAIFKQSTNSNWVLNWALGLRHTFHHHASRLFIKICFNRGTYLTDPSCKHLEFGNVKNNYSEATPESRKMLVTLQKTNSLKNSIF